MPWPPLAILPYALGLAFVLSVIGRDARTIRVAAILLLDWVVLAALATFLDVHISPAVNLAVDFVAALICGAEFLIAAAWPRSCRGIMCDITALQAVIVASFALELDFHVIRLISGSSFEVRSAYWYRLYAVAWVQALLVLAWSSRDAASNLSTLVDRVVSRVHLRPHRAMALSRRGLWSIGLAVDRKLCRNRKAVHSRTSRQG
jgi:hypothetical protein